MKKGKGGGGKRPSDILDVCRQLLKKVEERGRRVWFRAGPCVGGESMAVRELLCGLVGVGVVGSRV